MQIEATSVRWISEEAREAFEGWQALIAQEIEYGRARLNPPEQTSIAMIAVDPRRVHEETMARVRPMQDAAVKLYASYTMPIYVVQKSQLP